MRVQKFIAEAGICSRRKAEDLIRAGKVQINDRVAVLGDVIDPDSDKVYIDGVIVHREGQVYLMLNKPRGYLTTASDPYGRKHVLDLIRVQQRVFPVGRLDRDASGLLLLTNDGDFANKVMHPRYEVDKTYEVQLDRKIEPADLQSINKGLVIDRKRVQARAYALTNKRVEITVHTGMNKEVKRIFKSLGYWVRDLKRVRIGKLNLNVKEGRFRHLTETELALVGKSSSSHSSPDRGKRASSRVPR